MNSSVRAITKKKKQQKIWIIKSQNVSQWNQQLSILSFSLIIQKQKVQLDSTKSSIQAFILIMYWTEKYQVNYDLWPCGFFCMFG